ncbi:MAG: hypothetical protein J6J36_01795 [Clostridia bacterium]|nr:hypothetical protein [Clostridia bacterium]
MVLGGAIDTAIIRMLGIITDYDNELIKLSNVEMISANMAEIGFAGGLNHRVEKASVSLVNRKNILTISLVEE